MGGNGGNGGKWGFVTNTLPSPPPLPFPTPEKTIPRHLLGDGHQVTVPHHPPGDRSTAGHAHCGAQKLRQKTK